MRQKAVELKWSLLLLETKAIPTYHAWAAYSKTEKKKSLADRIQILSAIFTFCCRPYPAFCRWCFYKAVFVETIKAKNNIIWRLINSILMSFRPVYITDTSIFMPNDPVPSDEMEDYLGFINGKPSKSKKIVLRNNGIKTRYYALNKQHKATHTNAQMAALAVKALFEKDPAKLKEVDLLSCGTSAPIR